MTYDDYLEIEIKKYMDGFDDTVAEDARDYMAELKEQMEWEATCQ